MEQLQNVFASTDLRRKIIAGLAAAGMFAAILAMTNLASKPSLTLLYSGLETSQAGEIVKSLEARGVTLISAVAPSLSKPPSAMPYG